MPESSSPTAKWKIEFDPRARIDFTKLDKSIQQRIVKFLHRIQTNPRQHGAALQGETLGNYWKYRVGDYRLIADIRDQKLIVLIVSIGHRSAVYR
jgi:mRNA interferase RelE/StbE